MLSKSEKHNTNVDFTDLPERHDQHAAATQEHAEPAKSSPAPAKRLKKHNGSHAAVPPRKQDGSPSTRTAASPPVVDESLWNSYRQLYSLQFGNGAYYPVVQRTKLQPDKHSLCIVKKFSGINVDDRIHAIRRIKHQQFVQARSFLSVQNDVFVAFEYMPVSLAEVEGNPLLDDLLLASILGQVCCATFTTVKITTEKIGCGWPAVPGKTFSWSWPTHMFQYSGRYARKCEAL